MLGFIIFGWNHIRDKDYGPAYPANCPHCDNYVWWHPYGYRKWFTLFFIPLIPYGAKRMLVCEICGASLRYSKHDHKKAQKLAEYAAAYDAGKISREKLESEIDHFERQSSLFQNSSLDEAEDIPDASDIDPVET